ncbi:MAG: MFS transporter [Deltaproteobacteria bacterium]|nr:MFS transporter [Deltaproteobacteria bacterium]
MKHLKRWQEPIYAIGGFGPGFMYQIVLTYLLFYYRPAQSLVEAGAVILAPAVGYAAGMLIARILDGVVDLPIASWTDNMKSRWGRRRPLMIMGLIPTAITFILLWYPPVTGNSLGENGHWGNAVFVAVVSSLFFFFYTLIIVPYLASLSEIVADENSRVRVASWQTFFNTAGYVLTFVVAPIMFDKFGIRGTAWLLLPSILSFIGPILVIKEAPTDLPDQEKAAVEQAADQDVPLWESVKLTLANKTFRIYMLSLASFFFGLQFFLGGIAFMAVDMMGLTQSQLGTMNAAAFAPVPIMLIIFNVLSKKKGAKWAFRLALLVFAFVMLAYPLAWTRFNMPVSPYLIGVILGGIGSFSIGVFFTIPYAFPAQIAAIDAKETGKDRAGMFFAVQGLINQFVGSMAGSILAYGVIAIGPVAALACIAAFFFMKPYPLGKPSKV